MVHIDGEVIFASVMYIVFGIQFIVSGYLFLRNHMRMKKMNLYEEIYSRMSPIWLLLPLIICSLVCVVLGMYTRYMYSPIILSLILIPLLNIHVACEPCILRKHVTVADMRDTTFRSIIALGIRSRVLILATVSNLILMFYAFINSL